MPLTASCEGRYDPSTPLLAESFRPIIRLAHHLLRVPAVLISFADRDRQFFMARSGLDLGEMTGNPSCQADAVACGTILEVPDTRRDPRFADCPLVTGAPHVRFYAEIPLFSSARQHVGAFCIADTVPHDGLGETGRRHFGDLAALVLDRVELRRVELERQAAWQTGQDRFENIAATSPDGIICIDQDGTISSWNAAAERLFGHSAAEAVGQSIHLIVPERVHRDYDDEMRRAVEGSQPGLVGRTTEIKIRHRDGDEIPVELSLSMWREGGGVKFGAILRNISRRRADVTRLFRLAHHDPLTELPNRAMLMDRIEQLAQAAEAASILIVDLDGFKSVNDGLGHSAGDAVLKLVAERLLRCVRARDVVARLGGDEFALLLVGVDDDQHAAAAAGAAIRAVAEPILLEGRTVVVGASVGIATYPGDGSPTKDLLSNADLALYQAKAEGRHCQRVFSPSLRKAADRARAHEHELQRAYERQEFEVFYQPQMRLSDGALVGAEALLRWRHPEQGLLVPADFMPTLERSPLSAKVGDWVLRAACAQAAAWRAGGVAEFRVGVNLFGSQFQSGDLGGKIQAALGNAALPAGALELEITENVILRHDETMLRPLQELREQGVGIAFDDYGTGYASLRMLKRFPITRLKVDRSFVGGMCGSAEDAAIVHAILYLGHSFGLAVVAEGVEREEQAERLRREGCEEVQGYLFGRPMPAEQFRARFAR